jgi:hypothetical protein
MAYHNQEKIMTDPKLEASFPAATAQDVKRLLGDFDASTLTAMLALTPTVAEIEEVALWVAGEGETLPMRHQPRSVVQAIIDLIVTDNDEEHRAP